MIKITYPDKKPSVKNEGGKELIFCIIRKRWILISPEEWVRQNYLLFLTEILQYPHSLIAVEKQLSLGELKKRFDVVVYDKEAKPFMIVECKAMNVTLSENTLQQVLRYNISMKAPYVVVTNGTYCVVFRHEGGNFIEEERMPELL